MKKNLPNHLNALCSMVLACCALVLTSCDRNTDDPQPQTITQLVHFSTRLRTYDPAREKPTSDVSRYYTIDYTDNFFAGAHITRSTHVLQGDYSYGQSVRMSGDTLYFTPEYDSPITALLSWDDSRISRIQSTEMPAFNDATMAASDGTYLFADYGYMEGYLMHVDWHYADHWTADHEALAFDRNDYAWDADRRLVKSGKATIEGYDGDFSTTYTYGERANTLHQHTMALCQGMRATEGIMSEFPVFYLLGFFGNSESYFPVKSETRILYGEIDPETNQPVVKVGLKEEVFEQEFNNDGTLKKETITTYTTRDNQRDLTSILTVDYEYAIVPL